MFIKFARRAEMTIASPLGRLARVDPRTIWAHEAHDFTPWLLRNADVLADTLGIDLELVDTEHPVGGYSLDLLGTDLTNDCTLIVENQLTITDHSHLGQLVTYAAGTDAATVVWIAISFREEHRQAISFLNNIAGENARFFAVEITVVRIGNSEPAPLMRVVAEPNDWHAVVSSGTKALKSGSASGKGILYRTFWERFLPVLHDELPNWSKVRKPQASSWLDIQWPVVGAHFTASFTKNQRLRVEVYIDLGDGEKNLELFERLRSRRDIIEGAFGSALEWEDLPGRKACRIGFYGAGDVLEEDKHDQYVTWFVTNLARLREAFPPAVFATGVGGLSDTSPKVATRLE